jgi:hypothetical protein
MSGIKKELERLRRILAEGLYNDERTIMLLTDEIISIEEVLYDTTTTNQDRPEN